MRIGLQNTDWAYIGAKLAQEDAHQQAAFFSALAKELRTFDTRHQTEMQTIAVSNLLSTEDKELLSGFTYIKEL